MPEYVIFQSLLIRVPWGSIAVLLGFQGFFFVFSGLFWTEGSSVLFKKTPSITLFFLPGLDPAGPGYGDDEMPTFRRLDKTDAKYVDIIHSSHPLLGKDY